ncbi:hypothetical protein WJX74_007555 [Apatococcus lobatus]|uniref:JmjC domain-containing protein n=1 Tax=Apatococcus lobatus TaxID=904363 RepID=A0AAW1Q8W7_9CHLO
MLTLAGPRAGPNNTRASVWSDAATLSLRSQDPGWPQRKVMDREGRVNLQRLESLLLTASPRGSESQSTLTPARTSPAYGHRKGWVPAAPTDFDEGGSFPECCCFQYPEELGTSKTFPQYLLSHDDKRQAIQAALHVSRQLSEHVNLIAFAAKCQGAITANQVPQASTAVDRLSDVSFAQVSALLASPSRPVIITDAFRDWPAMGRWPSAQPACQLVCVPAGQPASVEQASQLAGEPSAPFYLNGWRAFAAFPDLKHDCPGPYFMDGIDSSSLILEAVDKQLFGKHPASPTVPATATPDSPWWQGITTNLRKVFIGPAGSTTRLHFDAGQAHGWLGQVQGRKLFILFPASDTSYLYPVPGETETEQSSIDPLDPDLGAHPLYTKATPLAFILCPGEAVVIPQGWWHYAAALDSCITVMGNFYHADTNAAGMVRMVIKSMGLAQKRT